MSIGTSSVADPVHNDLRNRRSPVRRLTAVATLLLASGIALAGTPAATAATDGGPVVVACDGYYPGFCS